MDASGAGGLETLQGVASIVEKCGFMKTEQCATGVLSKKRSKGKTMGRPRGKVEYTEQQLEQVLKLLRLGWKDDDIVRYTGVSINKVREASKMRRRGVTR